MLSANLRRLASKYQDKVLDVMLLVLTSLYAVIVLVPIYVGSIGERTHYDFYVGVEPSWYLFYGDQNYHYGPTYILARGLLMGMTFVALPLFVYRVLVLRREWSSIVQGEKRLRLLILLITGLILISYITSVCTAAAWLAG